MCGDAVLPVAVPVFLVSTLTMTSRSRGESVTTHTSTLPLFSGVE